MCDAHPITAIAGTSCGKLIGSTATPTIKQRTSLIMFSSNKIFRFILYLNKSKKRLGKSQDGSIVALQEMKY